MVSKALSTDQAAEQGRCGRVRWHGVTAEAPRQLQEKEEGGLQATWEGRCQSFSSLLNRLLHLGGCQTLRFSLNPLPSCRFVFIPCLLPGAQLQKRNGTSNKGYWDISQQCCHLVFYCTANLHPLFQGAALLCQLPSSVENSLPSLISPECLSPGPQGFWISQDVSV